MNKKVYDLLMAAPLVAWYALGTWRDGKSVVELAPLVLRARPDLLDTLSLLSYLGSVAFCTMIIVLLLIRDVPLARAEGILPRVLAVVGTFIATGFRFMHPAHLPVWLEALVCASIVASTALSIWVLFALGRSFAITAEARALKTTGPYAIVRHPLYVTEEIGVLALLIQYASLTALALAIVHALTQIGRTVFEERVLEKTFPEYREYRARTWRFIPHVI